MIITNYVIAQDWVAFIETQPKTLFQITEDENVIGIAENYNNSFEIFDTTINEKGTFLYKLDTEGHLIYLSESFDIRPDVFRYHNNKYYFGTSQEVIYLKNDTLISSYINNQSIQSSFIVVLDSNLNLVHHYEFEEDTISCHEFNNCFNRIEQIDFNNNNELILLLGIVGADYSNIFSLTDSLTNQNLLIQTNNNFNLNENNNSIYYQRYQDLNTIYPSNTLTIQGDLIRANGIQEGCLALNSTYLTKYDESLSAIDNWNLKSVKVSGVSESINNEYIISRTKSEWNWYQHGQILKLKGDSIYTYDFGKALTTPVFDERVVTITLTHQLYATDSVVYFSGEIRAYEDVNFINETITGSVIDEETILKQFIVKLNISEINTYLGINELNFSGNELEIYPNPAKDLLHINIENIQNIVLNITNILGQELNVVYSIQNGFVVADISNLETGIYNISITQKGEFVAQSNFVKE